MKRVPTTASRARRLPKASLFMQCAAWGGRLWFFGGGEASEPRAASAASGCQRRPWHAGLLLWLQLAAGHVLRTVAIPPSPPHPPPSDARPPARPPARSPLQPQPVW